MRPAGKCSPGWRPGLACPAACVTLRGCGARGAAAGGAEGLGVGTALVGTVSAGSALLLSAESCFPAFPAIRRALPG